MAFKWKRIFPSGLLGEKSFDVDIKNDAGKVIFTQKDVKAPSSWSQLAVTVVANKYFRGNPGQPGRETSIFDVIDRIITRIRTWGEDEGYFENSDHAWNYSEDLRYILLYQLASFNSPVWFNFGIKNEPQQGSACFIMHVEDDMESIINRQREETMLFKSGSGAGCNNSRLRASTESLSNGGYASGPVSFMRGYDGYANIIRSGGKTRRAAKMEILDFDHPDIEEFIWCKAKQEEKAHILKQAGFGGDGINQMNEVFHQNANHSMRVTDEFMQAIQDDMLTHLVGRKNATPSDIETGQCKNRLIDGGLGKITRELKARKIWKQICEAAWTCGDPGLFFDKNVNAMHTLPHLGPIEASNPCAEYLGPNYTACILGSLNLPRFVMKRTFMARDFDNVVKTMTVALDIMAGSADYPCDAIGDNSKTYRPLGLGYTGVGHLCMKLGLPYDSDSARALLSYITARMTGKVYQTSTMLMEACGFKEEIPRGPMMTVMVKHRDSVIDARHRVVDIGGFDWSEVRQLWEHVLDHGNEFGFRNSQATVVAPAGTISFGMDMGHSTGVEPLIRFNPKKNMSDSGTITLDSSEALEDGLTALKFRGTIEHIEDDYTASGVLSGAYSDEFYEILRASKVFQTALKHTDMDGNVIHEWIEPVSPEGHLLMMAAIQPFLSGGISKTVNLSEETTPEEIGRVYMRAWELGLKCVALYRDNSKHEQVYTTVKNDTPEKPKPQVTPVRIKLPDERPSMTHKVTIADQKFYLTCGRHPDTNQLLEIFVTTAKEGSTVRGLMDTVAVLVSICLQYGVPLKTLVNRFRDTRFEPHGMTSFREIPITLSPVDYIFKYLELRYLLDKEDEDESIEEKPFVKLPYTGELCAICGSHMQRSGRCHVCSQCGETTGCG